MTPYKELLADVRRLFRQIRKEFKIAKEEKHPSSRVLNEYKLEVEKIKRLTGTKRAFSLGDKKAKTSDYLLTVQEELETFMKQPAILESDRKEKKSKQLVKLIKDWDITEDEAYNFYALINSDEVQKLIEQDYLDSEQVVEMATNKATAKKAVKRLSNLSDDEKKFMEYLVTGGHKIATSDFLNSIIIGDSDATFEYWLKEKKKND